MTDSQTSTPGTGCHLAFLGPEGSHTHFAGSLLIEHLGSLGALLVPMPCASLKHLVAAVSDSADAECPHLGIIPVENALEGAVIEMMEAIMRDCRLRILADLLAPVRHCLIRHPEDNAPVRRVISHPQALAQCRQTLETRFRTVGIEVAASTSEAVAEVARRAGEGECGLVAIGTAHAAALYGLQLLAEDVSDAPGNMTRFLVVAPNIKRAGHVSTLGRIEDALKAPGTSGKKTSFCFSFTDRPGGLVDILLVFKAYGINLTRIESRPSRKRFGDYLFYADAACDLADGSPESTKVRMYLEAESSFLAINGPYVSLGVLD